MFLPVAKEGSAEEVACVLCRVPDTGWSPLAHSSPKVQSANPVVTLLTGFAHRKGPCCCHFLLASKWALKMLTVFNTQSIDSKQIKDVS